MATTTEHTTLSDDATIRPVRSLLGALRRKIRAYIWIDGIARLVIVLGVCFWVGLAVDRLWEPSQAVRVVLWLVMLGALGRVAYQRILSRAFAPLPDASLAVVLERKFRGFDDSLLTIVDLADKPADIAGYDQDMFRRTSGLAAAFARQVKPEDVLARQPLRRSMGWAVALAASVLALAIFANDVFAFFIHRVALSPELWPRKVHLKVEGFPEDGVLRVGRNSDVELRVLADAMLPTPPPKTVEIRYRLDDGGGRGREYLTREGNAVPGRDEYQAYHYQFKDLVQSLSFEIIGGDARIRNLRIEIVDRPQFVDMKLDLTYPAYMQRSPRTLDVTGVMQIPEGAEVALEGESNKPLRSVVVQDRDLEARDKIEIKDAAHRKLFQYSVGALTDDKLMLLLLEDEDGIQNQQPYRLSLSMTPDEAPQVAVALSGIGTAVTPNARIPLKGEITDDYGLADAWFEFHVNENDVRREPISAGNAGLATWKIDHALDAATWPEAQRLSPGQRIVIELKADDHYDLGDAPHVGSSQRFMLDVVTPEDLRAMLDGREMVLRQRFEVIYNEMTDTRDLLARIDFGASSADDPDEDIADQASAEDAQDQDAEAARRQLRVVRGQQNVQRAAYETLGVADAFDDIRLEMINNRIENDKVLDRLKDQIADPLRKIADDSLGELETKLGGLRELASDAEAGRRGVDQAVALSDQVLVEMKQVLDRMQELETYNEVVKILREIIDEQERLHEETQKRRLERLIRP